MQGGGGRGITYWYGILAKPFEAPTFGTNRYLDDIYKQQQQRQQQLTTLRRSPPLAHLIYDTFKPRQGERWCGEEGKREGEVEAMFVCMQITRSRHLADTHNHQLSQLSSRPIEIEHEIEIEMENAIANRDARYEMRDSQSQSQSYRNS